MLEEIFNNLSKKGTILITPNNRLALYLQNLIKDNFGDKSIAHKKIYPIRNWIEYLWNKTKSDKVYIKGISEELVWEKIITNSEVGKELVKPSSAVTEAIRAYRLIQQWSIDYSELNQYSYNHLDLKVYLEWEQSYIQHLTKKGWIDFYQIINTLISDVSITNLPNSVMLYGFDDLPKQYIKFLEAITNACVTVKTIECVPTVPKKFKASFVDFESELKSACNFVKQNPSSKVAIVIPELEKNKEKVESIIINSLDGYKYNISAPMPLSNYPLIEEAFNILGLLRRKINFNLFSSVLRSSFILIDDNTKFDLIKLELFFRSFRQAEFTWQDFSSKLVLYIEQTGFDKEKFASLFKVYQRMSDGKYKYEGLDVWCLYIKESLDLFGWPKIIDGNEDLLNAWNKLLEDFYNLNFIVGKVSFSQAISILKKLAFAAKFSSEDNRFANIEILGVLEACGMQYDYLWFTSLSNKVWPAQANPNSFLPHAVQKKYNLPRSSARRELYVAKTLTKRLANSVKEQVIFSYPEFIDGEKTQASALIDNIPSLDNIDKEIYIYNDKDSSRNLLYNTQEDNSTNILPNIKLHKFESLEQGASILKYQAECPFKAFAKVRLKAEHLPTPEFGISKAEKGNIIHQVLAYFWQDIKNLNNLLGLEDNIIDNKLVSYINLVLENWQAKGHKSLSPTYAKLEKAKILYTLRKLIELEKKRDDFSVYSIEQTHLVKIGPITFKTRIDRIDKVGEQYVLLDYKTGNISLAGWFGDRVTEPQLPLYLLTSNHEYIALAFIILRSDEIKFRGMAKIDSVLPSVTTLDKIRNNNKQDSWDNQITSWGTNIKKLADDFYNGKAKVNPKDNQVCNYCNLMSFCRV